tara:strand:- start:447 stop:629 length:183 start_codon:yes stop_codon:yes gene_type:complete
VPEWHAEGEFGFLLFPTHPFYIGMGYTPVSRNWQTGIIVYRPLVVPAQEGAFFPDIMILS